MRGTNPFQSPLPSDVSTTSSRESNLAYLKQEYPDLDDRTVKLLLRGERLQEKGQIEQALLYFQEVLRVAPTCTEAKINYDMLCASAASAPTLEPKELGKGIVFVDTVPACAHVVISLMEESEVALDLEGISLGRDGEICLIQVCGKSAPTRVYIFDITTLKQAAFSEGHLSELLMNDRVTKLVFDGRNDNDALYHQYNVCMKKAYDIQVLWALKKLPNRSPASSQFVKGLSGCIADAALLSRAELRDVEKVQELGKQLFLPERGGSYDVWKQRPLKFELAEYCMSDVKLLFGLKQKWATQELNNLVLERTEKRIQDAIQKRQLVQGRERARVDFSLDVPSLRPAQRYVPPPRRYVPPPRMFLPPIYDVDYDDYDDYNGGCRDIVEWEYDFDTYEDWEDSLR